MENIWVKIYEKIKGIKGKVAAAVATLAAGVCANFSIAKSVKPELEFDAVKNAFVDNGLNVSENVTREELFGFYENLQSLQARGLSNELVDKILDAAAANLSQVDIMSHYQPQTIIGTVAAMSITAGVMVLGGLLIKRKAKKALKQAQVEEQPMEQN